MLSRGLTQSDEMCDRLMMSFDLAVIGILMLQLEPFFTHQHGVILSRALCVIESCSLLLFERYPRRLLVGSRSTRTTLSQVLLAFWGFL